jgi:hypothetical protein
MRLKLDHFSIADIWFLVPFSVLLFFLALTTTFYYSLFAGYYYIRLLWLCFLILFVRELFFIGKVNLNELLGLALILLVSYFSLYKFQRDEMMTILFVAYAMRTVDYKKVVKVSIIILSLVLIVTVIGAYAGAIQNYLEVTTSRTRYYLGFRYSLFGPALFFNICALIIYDRKNNISPYTLIGLMLINLFLYSKTDSRLSFILTCLLIITSCVFKFNYDKIKNANWIYYICIGSFIFALIFSFWITLKYSENSSFLVSLDNKFGGRLHLGQNALEDYGVNLFGQNIKYIGNGLDISGIKNTWDKYNYVDNFYIHYTQLYGLFFIVGLSLFITKLQVKIKRKKDIYLAIILLFFAVHGIVDDLMLTIYYNMFFISTTYLMNGQLEKDKLLSIIKIVFLVLILLLFGIRMSYTL